VNSWVFVTGSDAKLREAERILGLRLERHALDLPEIQDLDVRKVVAEKARSAYQRLGRPVMVEDTGLTFTAWQGLPGALIRWFVKTVGVEGLCRMLDGFADRRAVAETVVATCDGRLRIYVGKVDGRIAEQPRGEGGFGWDPLFIPEGAERTFAEMTPAEKDRHSMRRIALEELTAAMSRDASEPPG
jgi:non-canonical purine NTP pyrophosphatase (RdgB/HAM1 family)